MTGGTTIGVKLAPPYNEDVLMLAPRDAIFLYTDGIAEAVNAGHEEFTEVRLEAVPVAGREVPVDTVLADVTDALGRRWNRNLKKGNNRTTPIIRRRPIASARRQHLSRTVRC